MTLTLSLLALDKMMLKRFPHCWTFSERTCWRRQIETFSVLLALCAGNSPVIGKFPAQRPVTRGFDVFFDLRLNKRLSKHSRGWWSETPSGSLWRHCNELMGHRRLPIDRRRIPHTKGQWYKDLKGVLLSLIAWAILWINSRLYNMRHVAPVTSLLRTTFLT